MTQVHNAGVTCSEMSAGPAAVMAAQKRQQKGVKQLRKKKERNQAPVLAGSHLVEV